jgi:hypothetical protein
MMNLAEQLIDQLISEAKFYSYAVYGNEVRYADSNHGPATRNRLVKDPAIVKKVLAVYNDKDKWNGMDPNGWINDDYEVVLPE